MILPELRQTIRDYPDETFLAARIIMVAAFAVGVAVGAWLF